MTRTSSLLALASLAAILTGVLPALSRPAPAFNAAQVPLFRMRARVTRTGGHSPSAQSFAFRWSVGRETVKARGNAWSPWLDFTGADVKIALRTYPNLYLRRFPVVLRLQVSPVTNPTAVDVQIRFPRTAGKAKLHADLFGPTLGILVWRDGNSGAPRAATMAGYNRRYWPAFNHAALRPSERPRHFLIADRFDGGDDDLLEWQQGISHLAGIGVNALLVPALAPLRSILLKNGVRRFALGAEVSGGPLGLAPKSPPLDRWASRFAALYVKAGYLPSDFSLFALSDEPGWYYPTILQSVDQDSALLEAFRHYLAQQHLTPAMLGADSWDEVHPIGHGGLSASSPLTTRRLFYWTTRFFSWYAANYTRRATTELHRAFSPRLKTFTNWNNFAGQFYFQGFPAHNPNPHSPDAAMGAPGWFQFGQMHGGDLMWTEDWFADNRAYQWSYYAAKLRSIAYQNGLGFGGYVIGRVDGKPLDGLVQRVLALVGSGAKAVFYYNFGPEYDFVGNCYSDVPGVPGELARADGMIAKAEGVLWPGREPPAQVAILQPRSSEVWDGLHIPRGSAVAGATNTNPNGATLDYMAEEFDEYLALEMSDIPVDFVDEDELAGGALKKYKVLYITEPDIPSADQRAIAEWVQDGGTLAMTPGAAEGDRYDERANILTRLAESSPHERTYLRNALALKQVETIGNVPVFGEPPDPAHGGTALSSFDDHVPAITQHNAGRGQILSFSWFPGLSYAHLALGLQLELLDNADANSLRELVLKPVRVAGVSPPVQVNVPYVETPVLESPEGDAITLLNWTGRDLPSVKLTVRVPFHITKALSVTHGKISLHREGDVVTFSLPLGAADIVELRR